MRILLALLRPGVHAADLLQNPRIGQRGGCAIMN